MKRSRLIFIALTASVCLFSADDLSSVAVLSYNIHHGASAEGIFDLHATAGVIRESGAHIVALQEVDHKTRRTFSTDLAGDLGKMTGMESLFRASMAYGGGYYGNAVLSKYPIVSHEKIQLPCSEDHEPRSALAARIALAEGDTILFISTHLDHHSERSDRVRQVKSILKYVRKIKDPVILAGDLNDCPDSRPLRLLKRRFILSSTGHCQSPTYPAVSPQKKIDYIMFRPQTAFRVISSQVLSNSTASDHRAYMTTLKRH